MRNTQLTAYFILVIIYIFSSCATAKADSFINILSLYVCFDDKTGIRRYPEIIKYLKEGQFNVIALQECTPAFLKQLLNEKPFDSYTIKKSDSAHGYSNVVLTSLPVSRKGGIPLTSKMGRSAPFLTLTEVNLSVVSVHLESGISYSSSRELQLRSIINSPHLGKNNIVVGDFNFDDNDNEEKLIGNYIDIGRTNKEVTYDIDNNALAKQTKFPFEGSKRLDRILLLCGRCEATQMIVHRHTFSDHWAVSAQITF
jgi:endonuclease/exonuclease/phosphatase family metal-dependent hydrolase